MTIKTLKNNLLVLNYQSLSAEGKTLNKRQSFDFLPLDTGDDDFYLMGKTLGDCLIAAPKSIEQNTSFILTEG